MQSLSRKTITAAAAAAAVLMLLASDLETYRPSDIRTERQPAPTDTQESRSVEMIAGFATPLPRLT